MKTIFVIKCLYDAKLSSSTNLIHGRRDIAPFMTSVGTKLCIRWGSRSDTRRGSFGGCLAHWKAL